MKQTLHIFRKDIRHYWPELAVSLALMGGFARDDIRSWRTGEGAVAVGGWFFSPDMLFGLTVILLPIAWMLLIVRGVQGEPLVGDRQFWVTRPYEWSKLLAAKVMFVLVTINVPLLVLDWFLLHRAGFAVAPHIGGLLWMQLLMTVVLLLPVATLATATATVAPLGLAILLVLLYLIGVSYIASKIPGASFGFWTESVQGALYLATCVIVILLQYARRRTALSRVAILALGAVVLLFVVATPYGRLVAQRYPQLGPGQPPPVELVLLPPLQTKGPQYGGNEEKEITIQLPLGVSAIQQNSVVAVNGQLAEVADARGTRWNSGWQPRGAFLFPGQKQTEAVFSVKRRLLEQMGASPLTVRISLALTVYEEKNSREFITPEGWFALPEVGLCSAQPPMFTRRIHCLAPLRRPSFLLISADMSATTCEPMGEEIPPPAGETAYGWIRGGDVGPAEFGISPVKPVDLLLLQWNREPSKRFPVTGICPGARVHLSTPKPVRRARMELVFSGIRLADYQLAGPRSSSFLLNR